MNPLVVELLGALLRWALTGAFAWAAANAVITEEQSLRFLGALTSPDTVLWLSASLLPLAWSLWRKYTGRQKLLTAIASPPGRTEQQIQQAVADGIAPSTTVAKTDVPVLTYKE